MFGLGRKKKAPYASIIFTVDHKAPWWDVAGIFKRREVFVQDLTKEEYERELRYAEEEKNKNRNRKKKR